MGFSPTLKSAVGSACWMYCGRCVGGARFGQGVLVHVKIDVERRVVDVQRIGTFQRAENAGSVKVK